MTWMGKNRCLAWRNISLFPRYSISKSTNVRVICEISRRIIQSVKKDYKLQLSHTYTYIHKYRFQFTGLTSNCNCRSCISKICFRRFCNVVQWTANSQPLHLTTKRFADAVIRMSLLATKINWNYRQFVCWCNREWPYRKSRHCFTQHIYKPKEKICY